MSQLFAQIDELGIPKGTSYHDESPAPNYIQIENHDVYFAKRYDSELKDWVAIPSTKDYTSASGVLLRIKRGHRAFIVENGDAMSRMFLDDLKVLVSRPGDVVDRADPDTLAGALYCAQYLDENNMLLGEGLSVLDAQALANTWLGIE